jgi:hypothetical protein
VYDCCFHVFIVAQMQHINQAGSSSFFSLIFLNYFSV